MLLAPKSFARMPAVSYLLGASNIKCPELDSLSSASDLLLPCTPGSRPVHHLPNYTATWRPLSFPVPITATRSIFRCFSSPSISTATAVVQDTIQSHLEDRDSLSAHPPTCVCPSHPFSPLSHPCFIKTCTYPTPDLKIKWLKACKAHLAHLFSLTSVPPHPSYPTFQQTPAASPPLIQVSPDGACL